MLTGYTSQQAIGQPWTLLHGPDTDPVSLADLKAAQENGMSAETELLCYHRGGGSFWAWMTTTPFYIAGTSSNNNDSDDGDGSLNPQKLQKRFIVSVLLDITTKKNTEAAFRLRSKVLCNLNEGICICDPTLPDCPIVYCNDAFCRITKYARNEVLGKNCRFLQGPGTSGKSVQTIREAVDQGREVISTEMLNYKKDGEPFYNLLSITPVKDPTTGHVTSLIGVLSDITELVKRRTTERALKTAKVAAETAAEAKSMFLANMSHEIRTPLNGMIAVAQLLLASQLTVEQKELVETILDSGDTLLTILGGILDFSKIDHNSMALDPGPMMLRDCVEGAMELVAAEANSKGLQVAYSLSVMLRNRAIMGDNVRMRQILANLLANAVKFTESGEVVVEAKVIDHQQQQQQQQHQYHSKTATIISNSSGNSSGKNNSAATTTTTTQCLHLTIRDTGIGISKENLGQLFEPFKQGSASLNRKYGGTGLGLVISKRLAELMGGTVWAESEDGEGSVFHFLCVLSWADDQKKKQQGMYSYPYFKSEEEDGMMNEALCSSLPPALSAEVPSFSLLHQSLRREEQREEKSKVAAREALDGRHDAGNEGSNDNSDDDRSRRGSSDSMGGVGGYDADEEREMLEQRQQSLLANALQQLLIHHSTSEGSSMSDMTAGSGDGNDGERSARKKNGNGGGSSGNNSGGASEAMLPETPSFALDEGQLFNSSSSNNNSHLASYKTSFSSSNKTNSVQHQQPGPSLLHPRGMTPSLLVPLKPTAAGVGVGGVVNYLESSLFASSLPPLPCQPGAKESQLPPTRTAITDNQTAMATPPPPSSPTYVFYNNNNNHNEDAAGSETSSSHQSILRGKTAVINMSHAPTARQVAESCASIGMSVILVPNATITTYNNNNNNNNNTNNGDICITCLARVPSVLAAGWKGRPLVVLGTKETAPYAIQPLAYFVSLPVKHARLVNALLKASALTTSTSTSSASLNIRKSKSPQMAAYPASGVLDISNNISSSGSGNDEGPQHDKSRSSNDDDEYIMLAQAGAMSRQQLQGQLNMSMNSSSARRFSLDNSVILSRGATDLLAKGSLPLTAASLALAAKHQQLQTTKNALSSALTAVSEAANPTTTTASSAAAHRCWGRVLGSSDPTVTTTAPKWVPRILVAEDNLINQKVIMKVLNKVIPAASVDLAVNGAEAVEAIKKNNSIRSGGTDNNYSPYDLVLMDIHMPIMDGLEAARTIRAMLPKEAQPMIVALSADMGLTAVCKEAGIAGFITKPFRMEDVERVLTMVKARK